MIWIENLYMMLAYAWNKLDQAKIVDVSTLPKQDLPNLLARVLATNVSRLLKRGLYNAYIDHEDELTALRGRIRAGESIKRGALLRNRAVCEYDDYSLDMVHNQIIKATLLNLANCTDVERKLRSELHRLYFFFRDVSSIRVSATAFRAAAVHHHIAPYAFTLDVCRLIHDELMPSQSDGYFKFPDFVRDEVKMRRVFQEFVYSFCRKELREFDVAASYVAWDLAPGSDQSSLLPRMQTDVSLRSASRHIILDTKYTPNALSNYYGKKSVRSEHLYQLSAYLDNQAAENLANGHPNPEGILLYPLAHDKVDASFLIGGRPITVVTIDLRQPWITIHDRLCEIVRADPIKKISQVNNLAVG